MSIEETIRSAVSEIIEPLRKEVQDVLKANKNCSDGNDWVKVGQAAKMLGCDTKHVNKLIENGFLSLRYLPGTTRGDRRISQKEIEELKEKFTVLERSRK